MDNLKTMYPLYSFAVFPSWSRRIKGLVVIILKVLLIRTIEAIQKQILLQALTTSGSLFVYTCHKVLVFYVEYILRREGRLLCFRDKIRGDPGEGPLTRE